MMGDIALHRIEPQRGFFRLYAMRVDVTLFGEPCLTIVWGRMGHKMRRRTEVFANEMALVRRWQSLITLRKKHGYVTMNLREPPLVVPPVRPKLLPHPAEHPRQLRLSAMK